MVCLQAQLNYFNRTYNLLTRWFTAEYSVWFDQFLPGLQAMDVVIPLGGTSNHFVTARLREIGGWNSFNVTEDADLGLRIYLQGWKTAVLETTTYEEATSRYRNWIRQRSRWVKGYMQTYLTTCAGRSGWPGRWDPSPSPPSSCSSGPAPSACCSTRSSGRWPSCGSPPSSTSSSPSSRGPSSTSAPSA